MIMNVAIVGAAGRMGGRLIQSVLEAEGLKLTGAVERSGHSQIGMDAGLAAGVGELGVKIVDDLATALAAADVLIDFTFPEVTLANLDVCVGMNKMLVSGSTGFTPEQKKIVEEQARQIPVVLAPNMSVGVNACFKLLKEAAAILGDDFDVEVVELHHNKKKDSPSGTAVRMGEVVAEALGRDYNQVANYHREGMCGERTREEIGMQTVRGGDIVGEHTVYFIGMGERIEISHRAMSRDMFARGAVRACSWLRDKAPGLYDMQDVLGLK
jgi:4-hydroxy-tetrahydrodipicolinate reductase